MKFQITRLLLILAVISIPAAAADKGSPPSDRPSIGLVLSGGGARGFAHVGVLKLLEENRIPVDYIGGSSMGALIGAMYSMGWSPDEIQSFVSGLDWEMLLQPSVSFEHLSFRRKEDRRNIPAPIALPGKISDLKLPNALSSGQEIELLLDRITLDYASVKDFDDLPIPFRAVAVDMVQGTSVTLQKGSLPRALRATMSIPGVFAPVEIDGRILADGGLVNNIPTNVVKEMGADILIVVNIETQLEGPEAMRSLPGVLSQTISVATLDNSRRSLRQADFIIAPDLGDYKLADFPESQGIIELGYKEARGKVALLKGLSLSEENWKDHQAARRMRERTKEAPLLKYMVVEGAEAEETITIMEKLGHKYLNVPFDSGRQERLSRDIKDLIGTGSFKALSYEIAGEDEHPGLMIMNNRISEKPDLPALLELGLDVNTVTSDKVNFDLLARLTFFNAGVYGAEWRNDLRLGSNPLLETEYFHPIGRSGFFISPQVSLERRRINYFSDSINLAEYIRQSIQAGLDLGYSTSARSELRAGYSIGYQKFLPQIGIPIFGNFEGGFTRAGLNWDFDGLDKAQVPTGGILSKNSLYHYIDTPGTRENFTQAETETSIFHALGQKNILFGFGKAGVTFGENTSPVQNFALGGRLRLGGYYYEEFRGDNYLMGGFGMLHNPSFFPPFLGGAVYLGAWYEGGSIFQELDMAIYRQSFSGGVIAETPFGPIFLGGSVNENGRGKFYFSYGRFF